MIPRSLCVAGALMLPLAGLSAATPEPPRPLLTVPGPEGAEAPEGHLLVRWEMPAGTAERDRLRYEVQYGSSPTFEGAEVRRAGFDEASFLSGLPAGTTFVRLRARTPDGLEGPWSEVGRIETEYPAAGLVRGLMALGALTLVALLVAIVRSHRASRRAAGGEA